MSKFPEKPYFEDPFEHIEDEIHTEESFVPQGEAHAADEWQWAMLAHLAGMGGFVVPFGSVIGPMILWSMKKEQMPLVDTHGKRAVNFNLTVLLAMIVSIPLIFVVVGIFLLIGLGLFQLVCTVMAVIAVSQHKDYVYPFSIHFIK